MTFEFEELGLAGLTLITLKVFEDTRGSFMETFESKLFEKKGINFKIAQSNSSNSKKDVLRGLHFQRQPYEQAKLVRCIKGAVLDCAVDIRKGSTTFGKHVLVELSEINKKSLYIPRGFAHGFLVLSDSAEFSYDVDNVYSRDHEGGIIWNDKDLNIKWPVSSPILSEKDKALPTLSKVFSDNKNSYDKS